MDKYYIPQPADVGFMRHTEDWDSNAIAWFMRSEWGHTFLVLEKGQFGTYTSETSPLRVTNGTVERYGLDLKVKMEIWRHPEITKSPALQKAVCQNAQSRYGMGYGYGQLPGFAVVCLLERVNIDIGQFIKHGIVCNQHVCHSYRQGAGMFSDVPYRSIHTEEFYKLMKPRGFELVAEKQKGAIWS